MSPLATASVGSPALWAGFLGFVLLMLGLDLGVFHRRAHEVSLREAALWSALWVALSFVFAAGVWWQFGSERALEFTTGYLIEKALSVDNIFVFVVVFGAFGIPALYQHRVLFWGILGALAMRAAFIFAGTALLQRFHWTIYIFGGLLLLTGLRLLGTRNQESHPERNPVIRLAQRTIPVSAGLAGGRFFVREGGRRLATPLFLALLAVEVTDLIFAVDSIPAIFAVTRDPFIVFTSNIFAILGLRSLYFLLAGIVSRFRYLKTGLALVLVFVGLKMVLADVYKIPIAASLGVVAALIGGAVALSLRAAPRPVEAPRGTP
ncbi:MAG TPA: TerC family protein [Myxococcaceae bacterium]|nr:TerC family protein [Myxococcaceae bacterium]